MRFFSLHQLSRATLLSTGISAALLLSLNVQAATVKPASPSASDSNNTQQLSSAKSADGIIAVVNENAILKSDLMEAIVQTQARAKATGNPIANSAQLQSEVLNALILRELQLSLVKRAGIKSDDAVINQRLAAIAKSEGLESIAALQQR